ncbi:broad specificity phosphatase PhoE [Pontibacter ummariensis]|uniref:Broad specificity phosphatase PhoE n=1 Tax=Pontibacter ummariensis TaxID=1610492 RepID=A0A239FQI8_9BACT|nr:histidine phosphatase family protein [Pontibacter ummariensis]PRY11960.1 broad specificity phosphatase PhoE [Pontibacter ummariensis]SNS59326.1 Broad specificity phosphatase PhoE [Pontibacter ummariensis]
MKGIYLTTLLSALIAFSPVHATDKSTSGNQAIENIEKKYQELSADTAFAKIDGMPVAQSVRFIQPEDGLVKDYSNLRQIALIRHGEPDLEKTGKFSWDEARQFLNDYDSVGIVSPDVPFLKLDNPEEVSIFCSSINRARATAQYLFGNKASMTVSPEFREFETTLGRYGLKVRMPIKFWTAAARVKWILGIDRQGIESFADAKDRARKAAQTLADATEENPKAVLVAHGFLNRYIKDNLEEMGWRVVRDGGHGYLATTILVKIDDNAAEHPAPSQLALGSN